MTSSSTVQPFSSDECNDKQRIGGGGKQIAQLPAVCVLTGVKAPGTLRHQGQPIKQNILLYPLLSSPRAHEQPTWVAFLKVTPHEKRLFGPSKKPQMTSSSTVQPFSRDECNDKHRIGGGGKQISQPQAVCVLTGVKVPGTLRNR